MHPWSKFEFLSTKIHGPHPRFSGSGFWSVSSNWTCTVIHSYTVALTPIGSTNISISSENGSLVAHFVTQSCLPPSRSGESLDDKLLLLLKALGRSSDGLRSHCWVLNARWLRQPLNTPTVTGHVAKNWPSSCDSGNISTRFNQHYRKD